MVTLLVTVMLAVVIEITNFIVVMIYMVVM